MSREVSYTISFSKPHTHLCEVKVSVKDAGTEPLLFSLPVWTPGSYLIRDFAGKVQDVSATGDGKPRAVEKVSKNTWRVEAGEAGEISLSYKVYCNELTVRTSEISEDHAFISPSGVFMFVRGYEELPCTLTVNQPRQWRTISTGLQQTAKHKYRATDYDVFIDCPIELGNQTVLEFRIKNIPHRICITGQGNYDARKLISDFRKIAETQIKFFKGEIPYSSYTYIVHLVEKGGGGLEHLNSFVVQFPRFNFSDSKAYTKFLGLVSHEYFHLWNVKRIRPVALGPFDYDRENYTQSLWIAEGWTSFYDNVFLVRAGLINAEQYLELLEHEVNDVMRFQGRFHQPLRESSHDTWVKFYKKDENFSNSQVSYYTKGALAALMLNIEIMSFTGGRKSIDDVLLELYNEYLEDPSTGYTEEEVKRISENICRKKLDEFWKKYLDGTAEIPLKVYLAKCGIEMKDENINAGCSLDAEIKNENGRLTVAKVFEGGSAYDSGLSTGDEIIAINGYRVDEELMKKLLSGKSAGAKIDVLTSRRGMLKLVKVTLKRPLPKYKLSLKKNPNKREKLMLGKWLNG